MRTQHLVLLLISFFSNVTGFGSWSYVCDASSTTLAVSHSDEQRKYRDEWYLF